MPILDSDIVWRPSALVSDSTPAQNGGRMSSAVTITSGIKNNLFPDVSQSERSAGSTKKRKAFIHVQPTTPNTLINAKVFMDQITPGDDYVWFYKGSETDVASAMAFGTRPYGISPLSTNANSGTSTLITTPENFAAYDTATPFRIGDKIRVANILGTGGSGAEEFHEISNVVYGTPTITITLVGTLANTFTVASGTMVSTVLEVAEVKAAITNVSKVSVGGTITEASLVGANKGAITQTWTLTFTDATTFTAAGDTVGAITGSNTGSTWAPSNPITGTPYFTLNSSFWSGTWATGNTVQFTTGVAAIPVWYNRVVPSSCGSLANDYCALAIQGESA